MTLLHDDFPSTLSTVTQCEVWKERVGQRLKVAQTRFSLMVHKGKQGSPTKEETCNARLHLSDFGHSEAGHSA